MLHSQPFQKFNSRFLHFLWKIIVFFASIHLKCDFSKFLFAEIVFGQDRLQWTISLRVGWKCPPSLIEFPCKRRMISCLGVCVATSIKQQATSVLPWREVWILTRINFVSLKFDRSPSKASVQPEKPHKRALHTKWKGRKKNVKHMFLSLTYYDSHCKIKPTQFVSAIFQDYYCVCHQPSRCFQMPSQKKQKEIKPKK